MRTLPNYDFMIYNNRPTLKTEDFVNIENRADQLKFLVGCASFAPSSHNTQPWLFKIENNTIEVYENMRRALSASDKSHRQLYLSLGAAIENLIQAAEILGFDFSFDYLFNDGSDLIGRMVIKNFLAGSDIQKKKINAIITRYNNRFPYEDKFVPQEFLEWIKELKDENLTTSFVIGQDDKNKIINIVSQAIEDAFSDKEFRKELSYWIKPSLKKYRDGMPGYNIGIPFIISFILPKIIKYMNTAKQQRKMEEKILKHTPVFVIISAKEDNKENWLKAGQIFERIALETERRGLKTGVFAAPIEIGDYYKKIQEIINTDFRPQIFFRLGYCDKIPKPSPRLKITDIIIK